MSEQKKTVALAEAEIVTSEKTHFSDLWKKEDWLAIWIGFIVIALGAFSVLTGTIDFSAASFSTWGNGVSVLEQLTGTFWGHLLLTAIVLGILFSVGNVLKGNSLKEYVPAYIGLFIVSVLVRFISAEYTLNRYLEWAFWALAVGLIIIYRNFGLWYQRSYCCWCFQQSKENRFIIGRFDFYYLYSYHDGI